MSEPLLEAFREDAELTTPVPAFDLIERAGRARRRRRYAVTGAVAACVLAVSGLLAAQGAAPSSPQPAEHTESGVTPWPGPTMTTLPAGTYEFASSVGPYSPTVRLTLPRGWNAWEGPNRFEGLGRQVTHDAKDNERVLTRADWYADVRLLQVQWIAQRGCTMADVREGGTSRFVQALTHTPGLHVVQGPTSGTHAGHAAVHVRFRVPDGVPSCLREFLFQATPGPIGLGDPGEMHDAWVIDVDGESFLVWASWTRRTPPAEVDALLGIVDSIELHDRE
ncbi:hypothetical protein [Nocardioides sp. Soil805]|uniref:hypothetical protein n=1 Tax=Nocardioides sp. Soil805 TaxID=1736416 RepID=UPI0007037383|nr:hypothetical protein [Nocardioides sp. Soil805]KRF34715.1 hypothetical protein ASG94_11100 [Nocardioides sp. Soil805]